MERKRNPGVAQYRQVPRISLRFIRATFFKCRFAGP